MINPLGSAPSTPCCPWVPQATRQQLPPPFPTMSSSPAPPGMCLGWFPNVMETSAEKIHFGKEFYFPRVKNSKPSLAHLFQDSTSSLPLQT